MEDEITALQQRLRAGETIERYETVQVRADGQQVHVEITLFPIRDAGGQIVDLAAIARDVTVRVHNIQEIAQLNTSLTRRAAELALLNEELNAFNYSISHDLRVPLRAINGFSQLLLKQVDQEPSAKARDYAQRVVTAGQRMSALVDGLLAFAQMNREPLHKCEVFLTDMAQAILAEVANEMEGRKVEVTVEDLPPCKGDPVLLKQVLSNLITNALKFTRTREVARIEIGCYQDSRDTVYFVRDNGVGFDMRYADRLFGVFQRLHHADEFSGTGVGLAIVQRIIHRHGGHTWAEAEIDTGATFFFIVDDGPEPLS